MAQEKNSRNVGAASLGRWTWGRCAEHHASSGWFPVCRREGPWRNLENLLGVKVLLWTQTRVTQGQLARTDKQSWVMTKKGRKQPRPSADVNPQTYLWGKRGGSLTWLPHGQMEVWKTDACFRIIILKRKCFLLDCDIFPSQAVPENKCDACLRICIFPTNLNLCSPEGISAIKRSSLCPKKLNLRAPSVAHCL